ncbi:peptidase C39 family protein [Leifsonia sp. YAF41]|uniref:peptidase C39 family protein n=1 Tax=Leifsonia sp. YAF41 TaxID=3233086 RepID=UPI003F9E70DD
MTSLTHSTVRTVTAAELTSVIGAERAAAWHREHPYYERTVLLLERDDSPLAAAVVTSRPHSAYTKIVDVWFEAAADGEELLHSIIERSRLRGDAAVKWEFAHANEAPAFASDLGFDVLPTPYLSGAGTEGVRGLALWVNGWSPLHNPYYAQTTDFTCGAVAALTAIEMVGVASFVPSDLERNRLTELGFWRVATNFPACEPVGLAVALDAHLKNEASGRIEVYLDHEGAVLLEDFDTDAERLYRELLQSESLQLADEQGVAVSRERISIAEIAERVTRGWLALLLIDEKPMHGSSVPHWVLAHSVHDGVLVFQDPWIDSEHGETWVDSHDLPISFADVELMNAFGEAAYRGIIFLERTERVS